MINSVNLIGRITKELEMRYTPSGVAVCRFTLAVNRTFSNQNGEREADFISCVAFKKTAENMSNFLGKGSLVGIEGRLQSGSYENQEGKRVYTTDVIVSQAHFLEPKQQSKQQNQQNQNSGYGNQGQGNYNGQQPSYGSQPNYSAPPQQQQNYNPQMNNTTNNNQYNGNYQEVSEDDLPF